MTPLHLLVTWGIGVVLGLAVSAVVAGVMDNTDNRLPEVKGDDISLCIGASIFWPVIVAGLLAFAPFYALYKLGQWYGRRM